MRSCSSFNDEVKNRYDFTKKRNMKTLIQQVKQGWNGHTWNDEDIGVRVHKPVTGEMCSKFFDHCIKDKKFLPIIVRTLSSPRYVLFRGNKWEGKVG